MPQDNELSRMISNAISPEDLQEARKEWNELSEMPPSLMLKQGDGQGDWARRYAESLMDAITLERKVILAFLEHERHIGTCSVWWERVSCRSFAQTCDTCIQLNDTLERLLPEIHVRLEDDR